MKVGRDNRHRLVPSYRFPDWHVCPKCNLLQRSRFWGAEIGKPELWCPTCSSGRGRRIKKVYAVPVPYAPLWPMPPPLRVDGCIINSSGELHCVAGSTHTRSPCRVDQITDQNTPTCIELSWSLSCNIRGLAECWRIRREHNPLSLRHLDTHQAVHPVDNPR